jgi:hypothetical protein
MLIRGLWWNDEEQRWWCRGGEFADDLNMPLVSMDCFIISV